MRLKYYIEGVSKYLTALNKLSSLTNINRFYLYLDCLWSRIRYGCVLNHYIDGRFYLRKSFERKRIVTYRTWNKLLTYNDAHHTHLLKNKNDFNQFFSEYIGREWLYVKNVDYLTYKDFFCKHQVIFIKPFNGWEGEGCRKLEYNEENCSKETFDKLNKENCIIEEVVIQHPSMVFNNKAVNTIRVYTIYDSVKNSAYCIKTVLRAGVGDNIVDNSHSGGVTYQIDLSTGFIVSKGWRNGQAERLIIHPKTDICMLGYKIPYYQQVKTLCCQAASKIPQVRFIGWDVAITNKGPILIEGNHDPDIDVMEFVGDYGYKTTIFNHLN